MRIGPFVTNIEIILVGEKKTCVLGTSVSTITTEAALSVELKDLIEMIGMTRLSTPTAKAGVDTVSTFGALATGVEVLTHVAEFVGAGSHGALLHLSGRTTLGLRHDGRVEKEREKRKLEYGGRSLERESKT